MVNNKKVDSIKLDYLIQSKQLSQIYKVQQKPCLISIDLVYSITRTQKKQCIVHWQKYIIAIIQFTLDY